MILQKDKPNIFIVFIINNHYIRWEEVKRNTSIYDIELLLYQKYKIFDFLMDIEGIEIDETILQNVKIKKFIRKKNDNGLSIRVFTDKPIKIPHDVI